MQQILESHPYIQEIILLENQNPERLDFHKKAEHLLSKMGADDEFLKLIVKRNLDDNGFLNQKWSMYNIPFFYIYETPDFYLKIHFFPKMEHFVKGTAAHCIHHHNNYILTTAAIFGSGYETILFDKKVEIDPQTLKSRLSISKHFTQAEFPVHRIDAWEPHIVFNPEKFSATLQLWTPDQKRVTDSLRFNPVLKFIKQPLRKLIYLFGMEKNFGIAAQKTYQWYVQNNQFMAIEEDVYFKPTREDVGPLVNNFSIQTVCYFIQNRGLVDKSFLTNFIKDSRIPSYYKPYIQLLLDETPIEETFCKKEINIPLKTYTIQDVFDAAASN